MGPFEIVIYFILLTVANADKKCAAREIPGQSVVCVCNTTYCDELTREPPAPGKYVAYKSSECGFRLAKMYGEFSNCGEADSCHVTLNIDPETKYQSVLGFGGAVTDSAGINWKNLSDANLQKKLIDSYVSEKGLKYNMLRVPIGGTDFSTHPYAYNELPVDDISLSNFSLSYEDHQYKIPMIKAILDAATAPIHIVATTWSPPTWMKTNGKITGYSRLKDIYYQTYADYHLKFAEKYRDEGILIWGITTTNEPMNGVLNLSSFNTLGWVPDNMGKWIAENLGPTIRNSTFKDLKILAFDDQRLILPLWFNVMIRDQPDALKYIDGVAVHYYTDMFVPASVLELISSNYPDKFILATEACEGSVPWTKDKVLLGSWQRAKNYLIDIIEDMNYNVVGWIDWNLCLNIQGGPNWVNNFVDSPIIVFPEKKEFIKQPMYYSLAHFSKFVPRDSRRIKVTVEKSFLTSGVENLAFLTPYNTIVVIFYNGSGDRDVCIRIGEKKAVVSATANSVVTVEFLKG